jgi:hypothetical protein
MKNAVRVFSFFLEEELGARHQFHHFTGLPFSSASAISPPVASAEGPPVQKPGLRGQ